MLSSLDSGFGEKHSVEPRLVFFLLSSPLFFLLFSPTFSPPHPAFFFKHQKFASMSNVVKYNLFTY